MLRDARTLAPGVELTADLCIVGAGAAGITLARRLSGRGLRVLVLESGSFEIEAQHQALYAGTMSGLGGWTLDDHRWRLFGGSTARWGGFCMPLRPGDFTARDHIPGSGWPITFGDLEPSYRLASQGLEIGDFEYDAAVLAAADDLPLIEGSGRLETHVFRFSPPTRMGPRHRAELAAADDVEVQMWANAIDIVLDDGLARVDHLLCATLDGARFTVAADRYVLAMGGLENARLLLASGSQIDGGVAGSSGLVGAYFMEHPHLYSSAMWVEPGALDARFYGPHPTGEAVAGRRIEVCGVLALSEETRDSERLPHITAFLEEAPLDGGATGSIPAAAVSVLARRAGRARLFGLTIRAEQTPTRESALSLSDERDALRMPRLDLRWVVSDGDRIAYARAMEILGAELAAAGLGRLWTPVDQLGRFDHPIRPGGHHMGTVRMHADPARGVVDASCRTHDVDNLYVAGSAVFTTGGAANPTLTLVALAERLAAHLIEESA